MPVSSFRARHCYTRTSLSKTHFEYKFQTTTTGIECDVVQHGRFGACVPRYVAFRFTPGRRAVLTSQDSGQVSTRHESYLLLRTFCGFHLCLDVWDDLPLIGPARVLDDIKVQRVLGFLSLQGAQRQACEGVTRRGASGIVRCLVLEA